MRSPPDQRLRPGALLLELSIWVAPALAFLWIYTNRLGGASTAIVPHLQVILALFAATVLLRVTVRATAGRGSSATAGALLGAACLFALWVYYVVAVIGFRAWGYLVSWALIETYLHQASYMVDVVGPGIYAMGALAAGLLVALAVALLVFYRRADWVGVAWRLGAGTRMLVALASVVLLGRFAWSYVDLPPANEGEPLALTIWPKTFERKFQTNLRPQGGLLERKEEAARAAYGRGGSTRGTNVILFVVDALRTRNMGLYGYGRPTTPFLSRQVEEGSATRILHAHSVCSESSCGLLGIASSRYIHQLVDEPLALTEVLRLHGYQAHMVLSGDHSGFYGLRKLYGTTDSFVDGRDSKGYTNDDTNAIEALKRLDLRSTRNNFIQVHLMSAHIFGRRSKPERFGEAKSYISAVAGLPPSGQDVQRFVNFYDAGVADADEMIRRALGVLEGRGLLEDALVIVTADHGEFVGELGHFGHAKGVRGEVIDVPLVLMATGRGAPLEVDARRRASQVDIAPTILFHLGVPVPSVWSGVPLQLPLTERGEREIHFQQNAEFGLIWGRADGHAWKYWLDAGSGQEFAFDLDADPGETINRASEIKAAERQQLRGKLLAQEVIARESLGSR